MKRKTTKLLFLCLFLTCGISLLKAQKEITFTGIDEPPPPLHFVISGGYTFPNVAGTYVASQGTGSNSGSFNPFYVEVGYAFREKWLFSLYFSDAQGSTGNYAWYDTTNTLNSYYYSVSIVTIGASTLYHFGNNPHFSPYIGGMIGYRFINIQPYGNLPDPGSAIINLNTLSYQIFAGTTWYFLDWMGLDARAGYGNNYYLSLGLSFRFIVNRD